MLFDGDSFREHVENGVKFQTDSGKVLASGTLPDAGFYTVNLAKSAGTGCRRNVRCGGKDPHAWDDAASGSGVCWGRAAPEILT